MRKIDRSIVPRCFRASFLSSSRVSFALLSSSSLVLFFSSQKRQNARRRGRRHMYSFGRAIASRRFVFLYTLTSRRFLSLSLSNNTVCCIGAGYVGGPTMAMIALKCPHIEVNRESVSHQSRFCAFHHDIMSICSRLQNARVQNVPVFDTPPGPGGGAIFSMTRATQSPKRKDRDERLVALLVVFCRRFSSGVGCSLSLSLFRANVTLIFRCLLLNVHISFLLRAKRSPWSI